MTIARKLDLGPRSLPVVTASEAAECGLACMAMVARFHGHDIDMNALRQRYALSLAGASLKSLMGIADQLGFSTRALKVELQALRRIRLPAILHWDLNHFVVLKSVGRRGVVIHDPATGARTLPFDEVSRHFTGVALELARAESFEPLHERTPMKLSRLWSRLDGWWSALAQVLVLSAALQLAAFVAPLQMQLVVDQALAEADGNLLTVIALGFGALVVVQAGIEALRSWALRMLGHLLSFQITGNLVRHLLRLPSDFFEKRHVGDIVSRLGSVKPIQDAITQGVVGTVIDGAMASVAAVVLFFYSPLLGFIVVVAVLINLAVTLALFPGMQRRTQEAIIADAKEQSHLMETVRAATTLKLLGREAVREGAWRNLHADTANANISLGRLQVSLAFFQSAITGLQTVLVIYVAGRMILAGEGFSVGMLFAFLSYRQTFTDRTFALVNQMVQFRFLRLHLDRLSDIVLAPAETRTDAPGLIDVSGSIRLKQVSFRYGATDPLVLEDVNLEIEPGDYIAIQGPSGGGKTTLLKLLLGLDRPTDGLIELDGQPATPERWRSWRSHVGVVAQDDRLLSGSIADNIAGFDPDLDMQRVVAAAMAAQIHADIMRSPMQYLTLVGDMGSTLSGGQRQRVLLARALYRQPSILILDEGTANLDDRNEELIAELLDRMAITRIVVAHRPALLRNARRIFTVRDRRLSEVSTSARAERLTPVVVQRQTDAPA
ncbi:peptidase domain-containing ABC transporter [Labrys wisconsinensis]|uniref:ATP-binding cassette subfamily B protein RaxB n=1 Tax=Labrys wisconsinensis TaxID=425677 RepID=A0ABU0JKH2_9HYPH|nr:peptidase domain-containing ABC transporter [Labrys wisconsinensis]MDQ0474786.1 ATP-binding cassette subfamily B protein RaxB [Labrys wisconsinensis]